jgi:hypothetical protein
MSGTAAEQGEHGNSVRTGVVLNVAVAADPVEEPVEADSKAQGASAPPLRRLELQLTAYRRIGSSVSASS